MLQLRPLHSEAVTEEELSRALMEGEEVTAPGGEGTGSGRPEMSYALSTADTAADTQQDTLSYGEETRCLVAGAAGLPLGLQQPGDGAGEVGRRAWGTPDPALQSPGGRPGGRGRGQPSRRAAGTGRLACSHPRSLSFLQRPGPARPEVPFPGPLPFLLAQGSREQSQEQGEHDGTAPAEAATSSLCPERGDGGARAETPRDLQSQAPRVEVALSYTGSDTPEGVCAAELASVCRGSPRGTGDPRPACGQLRAAPGSTWDQACRAAGRALVGRLLWQHLKLQRCAARGDASHLQGDRHSCPGGAVLRHRGSSGSL